MVSFYLMTLKGFNVLSSVLNEFGSGMIDSVVSERDAHLEHDYYEEIKELCAYYKIPFYNRKDKFRVNSQFLIAISWRWLINNPNGKLIVLHDSLLPKYRGFNPLVTALINGDTKVGVTSLFANEEFDKGDIIYQSSIDIQYPVTISEAINKVSVCYVEVIKSIFTDIVNNEPLPSAKQQEEFATYSLWRDEDDYRIDWSQSADYIKRFIDSLGSPYKGAKSIVNNNEIRILEAEVSQDLNISNRTPGKVIFNQNNVLFVVCGIGILKIIKMTDADGNAYLPNNTRIRFR